ncbi:hypothetical protein ACFYUY_05705 [Kitasatospora sp. NPDC004745]|uniref:hypothetical protein n=1 Tax=Kitasatospora sp. NPDC004745 TaxID=3364019 RepID=UPI003697FCFE
MSTSWRQRVLERNRLANAQFFADQEEDHLSSEAYQEDLRKNWLEAARHYDPTARLYEELTVRLRGEAADRGALDFRVGDALLKPLREGVSAAARKDVDLELTGVSRGSTVLHIHPKFPEIASSDAPEIIEVDSSAADPAIRDLLKLIDAAEHEQDVRQWERIVPCLDGLVEALDRFDLSMEMRWSSLDGSVRASHLSGRGKSYVRSLRALQLSRTKMAVTGRITELREKGLVKIKTGSAKNSTAYEIRVSPEHLMSMHLELGVTVSFVVEVTKKVDKLGRPKSTEYNFVRIGDSQEMFFE